MVINSLRQCITCGSNNYLCKNLCRDCYYKGKRDTYKKTTRLYNKIFRAKNNYFQTHELPYRKRKYISDINFKLKHRLSCTVREAVFNNKNYKSIQLLGCSISNLKRYLELKFQPGMNWSNHGLRGWHIDHIKPLSSFDLSKEEEQYKCFHYTNLQPLWAKDNLKKSNKILVEVT